MAATENNPHLREPAITAGPAPGLVKAAAILIHGRGQTPEYMFGIADRIGLAGMPYIAAAAADRSWYPNKFMEPRESNQPYLDHALASLDALVGELGELGLRNEDIVFVGFSQGACLACEYVYRRPAQWGGLVAFTGGLIGPPGSEWPTPHGLAGVPVFLGNSDVDPWVPLSRMRETADVFRATGASVEERVYPGMEHLVNDDEIGEARAILSRLLERKA